MTDNIFGDLIYSYTRAQAIADGVLHDVSEQAQKSGYKYPVAVTDAVMQYLLPPDDNKVESFEGRLHDVLWMLYIGIKKAPQGTDRITFSVLFGRKKVQLQSVAGPGDEGEPVITIMLPGED